MQHMLYLFLSVTLNLHMAWNWRSDLYLFCADAYVTKCTWNSYAYNKLDSLSEKMHEVTKCKLAHKNMVLPTQEHLDDEIFIVLENSL